jgi:hypothetical protein
MTSAWDTRVEIAPKSPRQASVLAGADGISFAVPARNGVFKEAAPCDCD